MTPTLRIAVRFLTAKKRAMVMSLSCIVLGVGLFIVTQATTRGFQELFIGTILGTDGAIRIQDQMQNTTRSLAAASGASSEGARYIEGVNNPKAVIDSLANFPNVAGSSPVLRGSVTIENWFKRDSVQVFGIEPDRHFGVSNLGRQVVEGTVAGFESNAVNAIVGYDMAKRLVVYVGDWVNLEFRGKVQKFRVTAIFRTGVGEIDKTRVYVNLGAARTLLEKPSGVSYIQVAVRDRDRTIHDAARMQEVFQHSVVPWQVREKTWLGVFNALRISSGITVSLFTLIAGIAMYNTLALIAMEKTKDIAILRSMGYTREDVTEIFLWQAAMVLVIGVAVGSFLGSAIIFGLAHFPLPIRGDFTSNAFAVDWSGWHYAQAAATAVVMVMVASLLPARRAARLEPGDVVRGTAT